MRGIIVLCVMLFAIEGEAKTLWSSPSITYLYGSDYELGDNRRQVITLEYAAGHSWGDTFVFVDRLESSDGSHSTYVEANPRFRVYRFERGWVKNVYFTPTAEFATDTNYLLGVGTDLVLPGFRYLKLSVYRKYWGNGGDANQLTLAFAVPFATHGLYDGFVDVMQGYTHDDGHPVSSQVNFTSQLKYNIGSRWELDAPLYIGVEFVHWNNKFGVAGIRERNLNFLLKWHF